MNIDNNKISPSPPGTECCFGHLRQTSERISSLALDFLQICYKSYTTRNFNNCFLDCQTIASSYWFGSKQQQLWRRNSCYCRRSTFAYGEKGRVMWKHDLVKKQNKDKPPVSIAVQPSPMVSGEVFHIRVIFAVQPSPMVSSTHWVLLFVLLT